MLRSEVTIRMISYLHGCISRWTRLVNSVFKLFSRLPWLCCLLSQRHNRRKWSFMSCEHMAEAVTAPPTSTARWKTGTRKLPNQLLSALTRRKLKQTDVCESDEGCVQLAEPLVEWPEMTLALQKYFIGVMQQLMHGGMGGGGGG